MALHVLCPKCGVRYEVADEQAGGTATCPACRTVARIPRLDAPDGVSAPGGAPPTHTGPAPPPYPPNPYASPYADPMSYRAQAVANFEVHRTLIGIFGIVVGALSLLWAMLCILAVVMMSGGLAEMGDMPPEEAWMAAVMYGAMGALSAFAGIFQLAAAILLLRKSRRARMLGIASGVIGCVSIWGCCVYLPCLAFGIYSLIVLCGRGAMEALDVPN